MLAAQWASLRRNVLRKQLVQWEFNVSSMPAAQFPAEAMGNSCSAMGKHAAQCPAEAIGVQFQNKDMRDLRDTPCAFKSNL